MIPVNSGQLANDATEDLTYQSARVITVSSFEKLRSNKTTG